MGLGLDETISNRKRKSLAVNTQDIPPLVRFLPVPQTNTHEQIDDPTILSGITSSDSSLNVASANDPGPSSPNSNSYPQSLVTHSEDSLSENPSPNENHHPFDPTRKRKVWDTRANVRPRPPKRQVFPEPTTSSSPYAPPMSSDSDLSIISIEGEVPSVSDVVQEGPVQHGGNSKVAGSTSGNPWGIDIVPSSGRWWSPKIDEPVQDHSLENRLPDEEFDLPWTPMTGGGTDIWSADHVGSPETHLEEGQIPSLLPSDSYLPATKITSTEMVPMSTSSANNPEYIFERIPNLAGRITSIKGPLLAGGFCDIFSGQLMTDHGTQNVAMKMLRVFNTEAHVVKAKKKFRGEVGLWSSLRHAHVLPFYGTFELDEHRLFMVSPWAQEGNSLDYLRQNPFVDRDQLLRQTASALEYLHSGRDAPQFVHGDLKADNVLISATGDALLCDFGLSRHVEELISKSRTSSTGRAGGHARFMSPELLIPPKGSRRSSGPTQESDVFAFASLMLQIYTEQLPFEDLFEAQAILETVNGSIPPRPQEPIVSERGLNDYIWALMCDCWRFKSSDRPNMDQVMQRLSVQTRHADLKKK